MKYKQQRKIFREVCEHATPVTLQTVRKRLRQAILNPDLIWKKYDSGTRYSGVCFSLIRWPPSETGFRLISKFAMYWGVHVPYDSAFIDDKHAGMTTERIKFIQQVCRSIDDYLMENHDF